MSAITRRITNQIHHSNGLDPASVRLLGESGLFTHFIVHNRIRGCGGRNHETQESGTTGRKTAEPRGAR